MGRRSRYMLWYKVWGQAEMKCDDCRFWEQVKTAKAGNGVIMGFCRRNPPIATGCFVPKPGRIAGTVTPQLVEMTIWPKTQAGAWCGEGEKKSLGKQMVEEILSKREANET